MVSPQSSPMSKVPLERDAHGHPRFRGCSNIREFEFLGKLGEGTFGYAHSIRRNRIARINSIKRGADRG
jgi:serine/threonine-protein kinase BUR1